MYACTVVESPESFMNLKPAYNTAEKLRQNCTKDKTAAESLDLYIKYLKNIEHGAKEPGQPRSAEQMALNDLYLTKIKARLSETAPKRTLRGSKLSGVAQ